MQIRTALQVAYVTLCLAIASVGTINYGGRLFSDAALYGVEDANVQRPRVSPRRVFEENTQHEFTQFFESSWALRGASVRTDNELNHLLFGELRREKSVVVGTGGVLFHMDDVAYFNSTDDGATAISAAHRLAQAQRILLKHGKLLLPVVLPSKTSVYRSAIPTAWWGPAAGSSDSRLYRNFVETLQKDGATFVDGRELLTKRMTDPEDIFPRTGRHLTAAASCRVLQEVVAVGKGLLPALASTHVDCDSAIVPASDEPDDISSERDLERLVNGWRPPQRGVPEYDYATRDGLPLGPGTIFVGSSFLWNWKQFAIAQQSFAPSLFYYYNSSVIEAGFESTGPVVPGSPAWRDSARSRDLYVMDALESFLMWMHFEFADQVLKEFADDP